MGVVVEKLRLSCPSCAINSRRKVSGEGSSSNCVVSDLKLGASSVNADIHSCLFVDLIVQGTELSPRDSNNIVVVYLQLR